MSPAPKDPTLDSKAGGKVLIWASSPWEEQLEAKYYESFIQLLKQSLSSFENQMFSGKMYKCSVQQKLSSLLGRTHLFY